MATVLTREDKVKKRDRENNVKTKEEIEVLYLETCRETGNYQQPESSFGIDS